MSFRESLSTLDWVHWLQVVSQEHYVNQDFSLYEQYLQVEQVDNVLELYKDKNLILAEKVKLELENGKFEHVIKCVYAEPIPNFEEPEYVEDFPATVPFSVEVSELNNKLEQHQIDDYRDWVWRWKTCEREIFLDTIPK